MSRKDGFFISDRRFMIFCRSNELGGREMVDVVSVDSWRRLRFRFMRGIGGGESGFMGTTLRRLLASISCRSCRDGRRLGGGGRLAEGRSGDAFAPKLGEVGGDRLKLACAVDGRAEREGAFCGDLANIDELRAGPRDASMIVTVRGPVPVDGRPPFDIDDLVERSDAPLWNVGLSAPNARVPVDWFDSTELERDRTALGLML